MTEIDAGPTEVVAEEPPTPPPAVSSEDERATRERRSAQAALLVFVGFVAAAFPIVLFDLGSYHWFFRDDFYFIAGRDGTSLHDLFAPHNAHWSTVPVVVFRVLWAVVGLRSYVPYQAAVLLLHLTAVVLLRVIMRRVGVGPWIATAAAATLVLFGPGSQNIVWAFQIGYTGSLVFGLAQLVLVDHDGPINRRDWLGLAAGVLALMSSGVGVTMAVVVGIATLLRRGWKVALFHTVPLAAAYGVYALVEHPDLNSRFGRPPLDAVVRWITSGEIGTFLALGHYQVVAAALAVLLVIGLVLAWAPLRGAVLRKQAAAPLALLLGGIVFSATTAQGRWISGSQAARSSRYVYLGAAFALPALAVAAQALARRWRVLTPALVVLFLVAIPANIGEFGGFPFGKNYMDSHRRTLETAVRVPFARQVPRDVRPIPDTYLSPYLTIGFLLDARHDGKLRASSGPIAPTVMNQLRVQLGVAQHANPSFPLACRTVQGFVDMHPAKGTSYRIASPLTVWTHDGRHVTSLPVVFNPADGTELTVELPGLHLRFGPPPRTRSFKLCRS